MMFTYTVNIDCDTSEQADEVMWARLEGDEDLGFDYQLSHPQRVELAEIRKRVAALVEGLPSHIQEGYGWHIDRVGELLWPDEGSVQ